MPISTTVSSESMSRNVLPAWPTFHFPFFVHCLCCSDDCFQGQANFCKRYAPCVEAMLGSREFLRHLFPQRRDELHGAHVLCVRMTHYIAEVDLLHYRIRRHESYERAKWPPSKPHRRGKDSCRQDSETFAGFRIGGRVLCWLSSNSTAQVRISRFGASHGMESCFEPRPQRLQNMETSSPRRAQKGHWVAHLDGAILHLV